MPRVRVRDKDNGFKKLVAELGEMGSVTIGVQGKEATERHPSSDLSVGELAAVHELGLGVPRRSWLVDWIDAHADEMRTQTKAALVEVLARRTTRNKALTALGYNWTKQVRDRVAAGQVPPPLAASTVARKGHSTPLIDTNTLHNAITYRLFLPHKKSIRDPEQRGLIK